MPKIYNRRKGSNPPPPPDAIYVGRPTPYGNPYGEIGGLSRSEAIEEFRLYALDRLKKEPNWLEPLRDKDLACWCAPLKCHADVLLRLANDDT